MGRTELFPEETRPARNREKNRGSAAGVQTGAAWDRDRKDSWVDFRGSNRISTD